MDFDTDDEKTVDLPPESMAELQAAMPLARLLGRDDSERSDR